MQTNTLPIEDAFGDVLLKAMRGNRLDKGRLARATGIGEAQIAGWLKYDGVPDDAQTAELARVLHLDLGKLRQTVAADWYPAPVRRTDVRRHSQHPHPSNGYVFFLADRRAVLVDPAGKPEHLLQLLRDGDYDLQYVLVTHKHPDHCDAAREIAAAFPQAQFVMHPLDVASLGKALAAKAIPVRDGEELAFGDGGGIRMLHTPGHTDGSACFLYDGMLFTGDTVFATSVGGAYGDQSTYADILESVKNKIFTLPPQTDLMPGHGPETTVGDAQAHNPFL